MTQRKLGRPRSARPLEWRHMVRLSAEEGQWLEQLAQERDIPIATLLRHIIRAYEEHNGDGRADRDLRHVR
jgi:transposase-like protein